ncbi:MAG: OmpA family protein [Chitinophagales bacterium]|nr:OmpA family protein [Chitinophagales bacterium]
MKKILFLFLVIVSTRLLAQETPYQVASIAFYNLENFFDTDSSMQSINVDKLNQGQADYVEAMTYDAGEYYTSRWQSIYENIGISKSEIDMAAFPKIPVAALYYIKPTPKLYEDKNHKKISKKDLRSLLDSDDKWFSKQEFQDLIKNNEYIEVEATEIVSKVSDFDNTPLGSRQYTQEVYEDKINKLATVIAEIGTKYSKDGPALIGLAEIENTRVLNDLAANSKIKNRNYQVVHYDGMYSRGVDVALLYQAKYFEVLATHTIILPYYNDPKKKQDRYYTRDILWVEGLLLGEPVHIFVNHWPSRRGGEAKSSYGRELGAQMCKNVIDSLMQIDPNTQVLVMGDLNDDPTNTSVKTTLGAKRKIEDVQDGDMYNPLFSDYKKGYGSLAYRGSWNLFDQILTSSSFVNQQEETWKLHKAEVVYNQDWINRSGGYEGGPNRSYGGNNYQGGFSDHLPSIIYLKRLKPEDKDEDGVADKDDECPKLAGPKELNGCPDSDGDGIADKNDLCPQLKGLEAFKGCPDTDEDGIEDGKDACPNEKGEKDNNGCPYKDSDKDGIFDKDDNCPETYGPRENRGCPEQSEEIKKVVQSNFENLEFETGKANIKKSSEKDLKDLAKVLNENKDLVLVISGHADDTGEAEANMLLSENRSKAVKAFLVNLGVEEGRITTLHYGDTKPLASNDTAEGRKLNRRVELEVKAK